MLMTKFDKAVKIGLSDLRDQSWTMQTCFSSYAHISHEIWLNFTQEINKCFKLQGDELKLKI
jgi:hypothetical protein